MTLALYSQWITTVGSHAADGMSEALALSTADKALEARVGDFSFLWYLQEK